MAANSPPSLAILVGAGSSAAAGVPTTLKFVDEFREKLSDSDAATKAYDVLLGRLKRAARYAKPEKLVDVEAVLSALETLRSPDVVDRAIARPGAFGPSDQTEQLEHIRKQLREFIRDRSLVRPEATEYLLPLIQLSNVFRPLPVFTVNYDVVIEQFLESHGLSYVDGFELRFDPELFEKPETEVLLYKLHGSVTWFKSRTGGYLKLPIRSSLRAVELLSGERAEPVMLYPAEKADYAGPFLELFRRFQETLRHCEWLIVLGYSFRDPVLRDLVLDAAVANPKLKLVLICGRNTERVYADNLAPQISDVPDARNQKGAIVRDRIIRLPYHVESALPQFISAIFPGLQKATTAHSTSIWAELHGEQARWTAAAEDYLRCGVLAQGTSIFEKYVELDPSQQGQNLRFCGLLSTCYFANGDVAKGQAYWVDLETELDLWLVRRIYAMVSVRPPAVYFLLNYHEFPAGNVGGFDYTTAAQLIDEVVRAGNVVLQCLDADEPSGLLSSKIQRLTDLFRYLSVARPNGFDLKRYLSERSSLLSNRSTDVVASILAPSFDVAQGAQQFRAASEVLAMAEAKYLRDTFLRIPRPRQPLTRQPAPFPRRVRRVHH